MSSHLGYLSSRYTNKFTGTGRFHSHFFQVIVGKNPFDNGEDSRSKPKNASAIGFSDRLWSFTQDCWRDKAESRPVAEEVVICLGEEASSYHWSMPAGFIEIDDDTFPIPERSSGAGKLREFWISMFP